MHASSRSWRWPPLLALCACGTAAPEAPQSPLYPTLYPSQSAPLSLQHQIFPLPEGGQSAQVAWTELTGPVLGGPSGLWSISETPDQLDPEPVTALAAIEGVGVLLARADGLYVYDGALSRSPLSDSIEGPITTLTAAGETLWIGADKLYRYERETLLSFEMNAQRIFTYADADLAVVLAQDGRLDALRMQGEAQTYEVQTLSEELPAAEVLPAQGGRLIAREGGALHERMSAGPELAAWRLLALLPEGQSAAAVQRIALAPSGLLWALTEDNLYRLDGDQVGVLPRPAELGEVAQISITLDEALWITDGLTLHRLGGEGAPVTYDKDIQPFGEDNCTRCHTPLGVAHPIDTYETWRAEIDQIIDAIEQARMPQDGAPLIGDAALIRRWKMEGFRR